MTSVVRMLDATLPAFSIAVRVTFVGSIMPAEIISTKVPLDALNPKF